MGAISTTTIIETNVKASNVKRIPSTHYEFAHFLRAIAAISVVLVGHFMGVFWLRKPTVSLLLGVDALPPVLVPTLITTLHSSIFSIGYIGVSLFFLISGFIIPFSSKYLKPKAFLICRFFRIYPTYWLGLTFTLITLNFINDNNNILNSYNICLQYLLVRDFAWAPSIDGISWTLEIEIKFYLLCGIINFIIINSRIKLLLLLIFILGCVSIVPTYLNSLQSIPPWLLSWHGVINALSHSSLFIIYMFIGTFFYWHCCDQIDNKTLIISIMLVFSWFSIMWRYNAILQCIYLKGSFNYFIGLISFYLFYHYRNLIKTPRIFKWLASISFSLFIVHPIVGYALLYYFVYIKQINAFLSISFTLTIVLALSQLLNKIVEIPSNKLGKKLAKFF